MYLILWYNSVVSPVWWSMEFNFYYDIIWVGFAQVDDNESMENDHAILKNTDNGWPVFMRHTVLIFLRII